MALGCSGVITIRCFAGLQSHATNSFDVMALQSSFDSKIQPSPNHTKLAPFISLYGMGQNLQYKGHSYRDSRLMCKIQNKMV